jgi:signal transduction histidine kinase/ligand-binding sensor domain-containing protein
MSPHRNWIVTSLPTLATRWALALLVCAPSPALALDPAQQLSQYGHRSWTQQQGLPQDSVRAIAQAPDGALWIGTDEGLARFDGVDFTVYRQRADGLPNSFITSLIAARDGVIWVGTLAGVSRFASGRFTHYNAVNGLGTPTVADLFEARDGTVWAVGGRVVSAFRGGAIVNYGPGDGVPDEGLRELVELPDGTLIGVGFSEVVRFDGRRFHRYLERGRMIDEFGSSMAVDRQGGIWIGTTRGVISIPAGGQLRRFDPPGGVPAAPVRAVIADRDGTIWIGTSNGLARFDGQRFIRVSAPGLRPGVSVWDVFEDRDGSLWVGTSSGLHRFREQPFTVYGTPEGFPSDQPTAVFEDAGGTLWIGFQDAGVLMLRGSERRRLTRADGLASDEVFCILGTRDGAVLVGTRRGLTRIDSRGMRTITPPDTLGRQTVYDAAEAADGTIWMATGNGAIRVDGTRAVRVFGGGPTLADAVVAVAVDGTGAVWAGTYDSGLWRYKDGDIRQFGQEDGLSSEAVRALVDDRDGGVLWIGTAGGGLSWWRDGRFAHLTAREGLDSNNVGQIILGDPGYLWLGTSLGLARIRRDALFTGGFNRSDDAMYAASGGLRSSQCAPGFPISSGGHLDSRGRAWVVTSNGLAMFHPGALTPPSPPAAPQIRAMLIDGTPIPERTAIELPAGVRRVEFQYATVWLSSPERLQYQYRLEGVDQDWISAGARRSTDYNNLPPGHYRFAVRATLGEGAVGPVTTIEFTRRAAWWEASWFPSAVLASLVLLGWLLYWLRLRQIRARFAMVLEERARISRELHDTLAQDFVGISSQLKGVASVLRDSPSVAEERLALARRMTQHSLTEARRSIMDLRTSALEGRSLPEAIEYVARTITSGSGVSVSVNGDARHVLLDADRQQHCLRIAQEAIANAVKHGRPGHIDVSLTSQNGHAVLTVHDDGAGFDPDGVFAGARGHFGLLGMRERARRMGGEVSVVSATGQGTTVEVRVPQ